jgi:hypothetical protein
MRREFFLIFHIVAGSKSIKIIKTGRASQVISSLPVEYYFFQLSAKFINSFSAARRQKRLSSLNWKSFLSNIGTPRSAFVLNINIKCMNKKSWRELLYFCY